MKIAIAQKQCTFEVVNDTWNFHFLLINAVNSSFMRCELDLYIHLSSDRGRGFLSVDLNSLVQIEQLVALLYSLYCS